MRLFWGIFTALLVLISTVNVSAICTSEHSKNNKSEISNALSDHGDTSSDTSHECPLSCHSKGGHCHGLCFQYFNSPLNLEVKEFGKLGIHGDFRAPLPPDLQGNRKPPKLS